MRSIRSCFGLEKTAFSPGKVEINFEIMCMSGHTPFDDSDSPTPRYALVYAPKHKRERVPEQCVRLMADAAAALAGADAQQSLFAALVIGPSRSSEGLRVFYVTQWL